MGPNNLHVWLRPSKYIESYYNIRRANSLLIHLNNFVSVGPTVDTIILDVKMDF